MDKNQRIKIHYIGLIPPEHGGLLHCGVAVQCWELAEHAAKNGYDVSISALSSRKKVYREEGILIFNLISGKISKFFYALKFFLLTRNNDYQVIKLLTLKEKISVLFGAYLLKKHIKAVRPDLIHIHTPSNFHATSLGVLSPDIPVVMCDHGFWQDVHNDHDRDKIRQNVRFADAFISDSQFGQKMQADYGLDIDVPNRLIHNPVSSRFLSMLPDPEHSTPLQRKGKKEVLFVGGVDVIRKGLDTLLEAFSVHERLKNEARLTIIANQEGEDYAKTRALEFGINLKAVKPVPHEELFKYYMSSDVLVVPSRSESFPLVYVESLVLGTPVVGFSPSVSELEDILEMYIGEKYDHHHDSPLTLSRKIWKVLNTSFDRQKIRERILERMNWDHRFMDYDSVYRSVLKK